MNRAVLETRDLVTDIPDRADGAPLTVRFEPGQCWGLLGPNGVGKTTLLHTLAGLRAPRRGQIDLAGTPLSAWRRKAVAQRLAMVFQEHHDNFPATVLETVLIGRHPFLSPWQQESADDRRRARQALSALSLAHLESRLVSTLSGGERQRTAIASALTQTPAIWLADEPTNHLDLHQQVAVLELLRAQARQGTTVIMGLHDLNLAARWCDHLLLLHADGRCLHGEARTLLDPARLGELYNQTLTMGHINGAPVFVPTPGR